MPVKRNSEPGNHQKKLSEMKHKKTARWKTLTGRKITERTHREDFAKLRLVSWKTGERTCSKNMGG